MAKKRRPATQLSTPNHARDSARSSGAGVFVTGSGVPNSEIHGGESMVNPPSSVVHPSVGAISRDAAEIIRAGFQ